MLKQTILNSSKRIDYIAEVLPNVTVDNLKALRQFLSNEDNPYDNKTTWKDYFRKANTTIIWVTKVRHSVLISCFIEIILHLNLVFILSCI